MAVIRSSYSKNLFFFALHSWRYCSHCMVWLVMFQKNIPNMKKGTVRPFFSVSMAAVQLSCVRKGYFVYKENMFVIIYTCFTATMQAICVGIIRDKKDTKFPFFLSFLLTVTMTFLSAFTWNGYAWIKKIPVTKGSCDFLKGVWKGLILQSFFFSPQKKPGTAWALDACCSMV